VYSSKICQEPPLKTPFDRQIDLDRVVRRVVPELDMLSDLDEK